MYNVKSVSKAGLPNALFPVSIRFPQRERKKKTMIHSDLWHKKYPSLL